MKRQPRKFATILIFTLISFALLSCNFFNVVPSIKRPDSTATSPSLPLYQQVTLVSTSASETNPNPLYTITTKIPILQASDDPRVLAFNQEMAVLVQQMIGQFKQWTQGLPTPPIAAGSSLDINYALLSPPGNLLSLKLDIYSYIDGAAHPNTTSKTVTYNLETGADISLEQLFQAGSNYLQVISDYCKAQLVTRDIGFDSSVTGADPAPENFQNWNVTADDLLITFDAYQVAAYAAGPQLVTIPYAVLKSIIDPQGPLASYVP
jgi:hypothetical protein